MEKVYLSRRATFSASHRLYSDKMSETENQKFFGKCASTNGHGHNYTLEVILCGPLDSKTGVVMNLVDLKEVLEREILSQVDHKHLNLDVAFLRGINPTTENLAVAFWKILSSALPKGLLHEVRIHETENNLVIYRGGM